MGYDKVERVEARGFSGGLWALWNAGDVDLTVEASSDQILHFRARMHTNEECLISGVYGSPNPSHRRALWETMRALSSAPLCRGWSSVISMPCSVRRIKEGVHHSTCLKVGSFGIAWRTAA
ncbi:unnamed protein product [Linum trigynum]|uniref:Uncharacterized protein n=1 Tax=Linum trigynum TaxID=586398 RepID=A0AAV2G5R0_9ROSI